MNRPHLPAVSGRRSAFVVSLLVVLLWGCGQATPPPASPGSPGPSDADTLTPAWSAPAASPGSLGEIPAAARVSDGGPDPRTPAYWVTWSTCGEGSQADVARQNGGRDAGWILVDDLIADPGLALGDYEIGTCDEAVAVLSEAAGVPSANDVDDLARQVLTAELNLSAGAESCEAVEKIVRFAQLLLSSLGYGGSGSARTTDAREQLLVSEAGSALADYNIGTLCR